MTFINMITRRQMITRMGTAALACAAGGGVVGGLPRMAASATGDTARILKPAPALAPILTPGEAPVPVWAYDGSVPGPVLRIKRDQMTSIRLENGLPQPTSIHWHGIRIDNAMDGVAGLTQEAVEPGGSFEYAFKAPDAGTYWYHPHFRTWEQVARGLYGALIVEEDVPPAVDHDLLFVADDWRLGDGSNLDEESLGAMMDWSHGGRMGNWLTINGQSEPVFTVRSGDRIRLRCINTSNARTLAFRFDGMAGHLAALDGQPLTTPVMDITEIMLAPAQRADLVLDVLAEPGARLSVWETSTRNALEAGYFQVSSDPVMRTDTAADPIVLPSNDLVEPKLDQAPLRVDLVMEGGAMGDMRSATYEGEVLSIRDLVQKGKVWAFNGIVDRTDNPLMQVARGRTGIINMVNRTAWPHAMHLHGFHFKVVERNGKAVTGSPWRDTELVERNEQVAIAFVADNPGKWLFHCHMLEHTAAGMITWIEAL